MQILARGDWVFFEAADGKEFIFSFAIVISKVRNKNSVRTTLLVTGNSEQSRATGGGGSRMRRCYRGARVRGSRAPFRVRALDVRLGCVTECSFSRLLKNKFREGQASNILDASLPDYTFGSASQSPNLTPARSPDVEPERCEPG
jgi:hypothetical protein